MSDTPNQNSEYDDDQILPERTDEWAAEHLPPSLDEIDDLFVGKPDIAGYLEQLKAEEPDEYERISDEARMNVQASIAENEAVRKAREHYKKA